MKVRIVSGNQKYRANPLGFSIALWTIARNCHWEKTEFEIDKTYVLRITPIFQKFSNFTLWINRFLKEII